MMAGTATRRAAKTAAVRSATMRSAAVPTPGSIPAATAPAIPVSAPVPTAAPLTWKPAAISGTLIVVSALQVRFLPCVVEALPFGVNAAAAIAPGLDFIVGVDRSICAPQCGARATITTRDHALIVQRFDGRCAHVLSDACACDRVVRICTAQKYPAGRFVLHDTASAFVPCTRRARRHCRGGDGNRQDKCSDCAPEAGVDVHRWGREGGARQGEWRAGLLDNYHCNWSARRSSVRQRKSGLSGLK